MINVVVVDVYSLVCLTVRIFWKLVDTPAGNRTLLRT